MSSCIHRTFVIIVDLEEERIHLETADNISIEKLPSKVPETNARYHLYRFKHTHEGDYMETIGTNFKLLHKNINKLFEKFPNFSVFIYSMPGYSCSIKERMLYSSCKNPFTETIASLGLDIAKKVRYNVSSCFFNNHVVLAGN